MNAQYPFQRSPRCAATSKRTKQPCKAPAVRGFAVCRYHGARSGAPRGEANGAYRHGRYTVEALKEKRYARQLISQSRELIQKIGEAL